MDSPHAATASVCSRRWGGMCKGANLGSAELVRPSRAVTGPSTSTLGEIFSPITAFVHVPSAMTPYVLPAHRNDV